METNDINGILEVNLGGEGRYGLIFHSMCDKDNIRHYIVAREV